MPDAATMAAARPCCPECGEKLLRIAIGVASGWRCPNNEIDHVRRAFTGQMIAGRAAAMRRAA